MKKIMSSIVVMVFCISCASTKKLVPGVEGEIKLHPDEIKLNGGGSAAKQDYWLFYDFDNKVLFVSSTKDIYTKFSNHLPEKTITGNSIKLIGTMIDALTIFTKEQLATESQRVGINLNQFNVVKITNWGLQTNQNSDTSNSGFPPNPN